MRITIPWGGIALIGGVAALTLTDWPSVLGWVMVVWGVASLILQILVITVMSVTSQAIKKLSPEDIKEITYRTNRGRALPVKRQAVKLRSVKSEGDVTIDSKQS